MNRGILNLIAAVCFVIAAVAFWVTGPIWLAILFTVVALLSIGQVVTGSR